MFWSLSLLPPPIQRVYLDLTQFFFFFLNFFNFHSLGICTNLNIFCLNDGMLHRLWGNEWKPRTWNVPIPIVRNGDISENIWENKYWSCCWLIKKREESRKKVIVERVARLKVKLKNTGNWKNNNFNFRLFFSYISHVYLCTYYLRTS